MPIMYNKTFHAPIFILPSQWFTMDGYGTTVYKSKNPRGLGSLRQVGRIPQSCSVVYSTTAGTGLSQMCMHPTE